jgi:DUF1365 family protein
MTVSVPDAGLYLSRVMHARVRPVRRSFTYRVFSLLLDIDAPDAGAANCAILSRNRFNILSFHDRDHGLRDGSPLRPWVEDALLRAGIAERPDAIRLLCFPRLWGFVFNPLSVFYCYRAGSLVAVVYEVNNTFGDTHAYVAHIGRNESAAARHSARKVLYVSPLIGMDATYEFAIRNPGQDLSIAIRESDPEGLVLTAVQTGKRRSLTTWQAAKAVLGHPLMNLKIVAAIHAEALGIWAKGARFVEKPVASSTRVSAAEPRQSTQSAPAYDLGYPDKSSRPASLAAE